MGTRRRSAISNRFSKMRGLSPEEKALMVRVGELIDAAVNNRTPTNPASGLRINRTDPRLPPPTRFFSQAGIRTMKISWTAVDSSILQHYDLLFINQDTGAEERQISFTNDYVFKGRIGGNYKLLISSVGRNGTRSPVTELEFFVPDNVMLLEGTKNSANTIGTLIEEDIAMLQDHRIFAWGSFTLDKLIAGQSNNPVVLQLLRSFSGSILTAEVIEEITMFPATESATNLDEIALGGTISRPSHPGAEPRGSTLETGQSVMFSPITVTAQDVANAGGGEATFFLRALNRDVEEDVTSLSLVLWSAFAGRGTQIPGDPFVPEPAIADGHFKCIETDGASDFLHGTITDNTRIVASSFTIGIWIKPLEEASSGDSLFEQLNLSLAENERENAIRISAESSSTPTVQAGLTVLLRGGGSPALWRSRQELTRDVGSGPTFPPILPIGDWTLLFIRHTPASGVTVYTNGTSQKLPKQNTTTGIIQTDEDPLAFVLGASVGEVYTVASRTFNGPSANITTNMNMRVHTVGQWNRLLTAQRS